MDRPRPLPLARSHGPPPARRPLAAEVDALQEKIEKLLSENDLLRARLLRMDPRRRPHFSPWQRLEVLWHQARYGLSIEATSRAFVLSIQTVVNWRREVLRGVARLVQSRPPMNRLPVLVEEIARRLKRDWPRWGTRRIAGILARLGLKASRSSVQRILRRGPPRRRAAVMPISKRRGLAAKEPGHIVLVDFTRLRSLFRSVVVGAVVDMFTRKVLAMRVRPKEPDASIAIRLLREANTNHGRPRWLITEQGIQFTSRRFTAEVR